MELQHKATRLWGNFFNVKMVQIRTFHMTWFAFFACFFAWFGIAPLMVVVRDELQLTKSQVGWSIIASVAVTILGLFLILFAATGIGNGSTFRTIAVAFNKEQAGPVLGWTSAVAAYGAFIIPQVFGEQMKAGTPEYALYGFAIFYAVCIVINWWFYLRPNAYIQNP